MEKRTAPDFTSYFIRQFQESGLDEKIKEGRKKIAGELVQFIKGLTDGDMTMLEPLLAFLQLFGKSEGEGKLYKQTIQQKCWMQNIARTFESTGSLSILDLVSGYPREGDLRALPLYSWYLDIPLRLIKPFTSKGDGEIHVTENPICREKVFQLPMVKPSTWKGNLRWVAWVTGQREEVINRLFGNERESKSQLRGRLVFFPTYFKSIGFDVVTPLDRKSRTPLKRVAPIFIECVPGQARSAGGHFFLLYVPFGWEDLVDEASQDLRTTSKLVRLMLTQYGFSARKTSGCGLIQDRDLNGILRINTKRIPGGKFDTFAELEKLVEEVIKQIGGSDGFT